jgi:uncharacterized protein YndB with AHSA1/START domain
MIHLEIETTIRQPPGIVFDRLADLEGYNDWMPQNGLFRNSRKVSKGPPGEGTRFSDRSLMGPVEGEISRYDRPKAVGFAQRIRWFGLAWAETRPAYFLQSCDEGTHVRHYAEGDFYGILRLLEPLFSRFARAERKRTLMALKRSLERRP